jgi:hypothetical protein
MVPHRRAVFRLVTALSLGAMTLTIGSCEKKPILAHPCACDHLVYFQATDTNIPDVNVWTSGNPLSTGDQVAWALITPGATISSVAIPGGGCGSSTVGSWAPYPRAGTDQQTNAYSGPLYPAPGGTNDGKYFLPYKITLSTGGGPCGRIIINKGP